MEMLVLIKVLEEFFLDGIIKMLTAEELLVLKHYQEQVL
jgi:hypothetical protein